MQGLEERWPQGARSVDDLAAEIRVFREARRLEAGEGGGDRNRPGEVVAGDIEDLE